MCKNNNNNNKSLLSQKEAAEIPTLKKRKKQPRKAKHTTLPTPTFFCPPFGWGAEDKHHRTLFGNSTSMLPSTGELSRCLFTIF